MMIRLGTCFSGIGAIEHALNRMGLDNEIVFACDNGDVDILSKEIPLDILTMESEITNLRKIIDRIQDDGYQEELRNELIRDEELFAIQLTGLGAIDGVYTETVIHILKSVATMQDIKKVRAKEYAKFLEKLEQVQSNAENCKLYTLFYAVEITNDFHKDNSWEELEKTSEEHVPFVSSDNIVWETIRVQVLALKQLIDEINGRRVIKSVRDICERLGMLHEKILTLDIERHLQNLSSYDEKKNYIDALYAPYNSKNQVKKSYMANYDIDERNFYWNVSFLDGNEYTNKVDLFVGGSPCQSFSLVGKQRGLEDTRGTLFYEYARLIKEIQPKVFIYENVKAILTNDEGRTWETITQVFTDLDYQWSYKVLNAKDYGIPQNRERVFVVGFRKDLTLENNFEFPQAKKLETTMKDFLMDNVSGKYYLPAKGVDFVTSDKNLTKRYTQIDGEIALCQKKNQQFNWHGDFVFEEENIDREKTIQDLEKYFLSEKVRKYVLDTGTKGFYSRPKTDLEIARPLLTTMHKMHRAGVDNYVTTDGRLRKLTPRECLRLMGFSDSFKIVVSDTSMYQQAGNSIVVDVLMNIVNEIIKAYPNLISED